MIIKIKKIFYVRMYNNISIKIANNFFLTQIIDPTLENTETVLGHIQTTKLC